MQFTQTEPSVFEDILERVLVWEGHDKITDDEEDAGGLTRWGITHFTLASWKGITAKDVTLSMMKAMTRSDAAEIYELEYFEKAGCQDFSFPVALCVFDSAVNLGVPKTVRLLQALVRVTQDGVVGPKTIKAVNAADEKELLLNLMGKRLQYYTTRPSFNHHGFGWFRRTLDIHSQAMNTEGGTMDIDLLPILEPAVGIIFTLLGIALVALASWAIKKFGDKLSAEEVEKLQAYVEDMIQKGLVVAKQKSLEELRDLSWSDANIKEAQLAFVVQYVVNQAPVYMTKLKLDEDKLAKLIESKI